jgi:hypothetical protein
LQIEPYLAVWGWLVVDLKANLNDTLLVIGFMVWELEDDKKRSVTAFSTY